MLSLQIVETRHFCSLFAAQRWWFADTAARRQCPFVDAVSSGLSLFSRLRPASRQVDVHGSTRRRQLHRPVWCGKIFT